MDIEFSVNTSLEDLNDYAEYFQHAFGNRVKGNVGVAYRRAAKKDLYFAAKQEGLEDFSKYFGLTPKELGKNLERQYVDAEAQDPSRYPEELAASYVSNVFKTPEEVLEATRHILARDLAHYPIIRSFLRRSFMSYAIVNTEPTEAGKREIDKWHPLREVKRLHNKPCNNFNLNSDQFLKILKAADSKLITYTIDMSEEEYDRLFRELKQKYLSEGSSELASKWNEQREMILELMLKQYLLPLYRQQAKEKLQADGAPTYYLGTNPL